ncbi:hypothetical protein MRX96_007118 [Rhipicephalus microplus]
MRPIAQRGRRWGGNERRRFCRRWRPFILLDPPGGSAFVTPKTHSSPSSPGVADGAPLTPRAETENDPCAA